MRRKIERERKTWSSLRHPNILPLYGFADDHDLFTPFGAFISPWRKRGDLGEFLFDEGENASLKVRLQLWQGVVAGVHHLHSHQPLLVHGDLKPGNVLIDDDWNAQLCDFGLVRVYLSEGHSGMTTASPHCGTERYLAWELVMADEDAIPTAASDIYATGCIGLEALFLEQPYSRYKKNVRGQIMRDMDEGNPPAFRPTSLMGHLDSLWEIVSWCWASDPLSRPQAHVLSTHVANILATVESLEQSVSARGVGKPQSGLWSPETQSKDRMATDRSGEMLVEISNPPNLASKANIGGSGGEQNFGIDSVVRQVRTVMRGDDNDYMDIDEISSAALNEAKAPLNTLVQTEVVGATPGIATLSFTDLLRAHVGTRPGDMSHTTAVSRFGSTMVGSQLVEADAYWDPNRTWDGQNHLEDQVMRESNWDWVDAIPAEPGWFSASQTFSEYELYSSSGFLGAEEEAASPIYPYPEYTLAPATNNVPQILAPIMSEDHLSSPMMTPGCSDIRDDFSLGASHTPYLVAHESQAERDLKPGSKSAEQYPATVASGASSPVPETGARLLYDEDDGCANPRKRRKLSDNGTSDTDDRRVSSASKTHHYAPPSDAFQAAGIATQTPTDRKRGHYYPHGSAAPGSPTAYQRAFKPQRELHGLGHTSVDRMPKFPRKRFAKLSQLPAIKPAVQMPNRPGKRCQRFQEPEEKSDSSLDYYGDEAKGEQSRQGGSSAGDQTARLPIACAPCKRLKMKCVFPEGQKDCCQHCRNSGRASQCVIAPPPPKALLDKREPLQKLQEQEAEIKSKDSLTKSLLELAENRRIQISTKDSPSIPSSTGAASGVPVDRQQVPREKPIDKEIFGGVSEAQGSLQSNLIYGITENHMPDDYSFQNLSREGGGHGATSSSKSPISVSGGNSRLFTAHDATGSHSILGSGQLPSSPLDMTPPILLNELPPVDDEKEVGVGVQEVQSKPSRSRSKSRSASNTEESENPTEAEDSLTIGGDGDESGSIGVASQNFFLPLLRPRWSGASWKTRDPSLTRPLSIASTFYSDTGSMQPPIQGPDERKETCAICHITIHARNMERHRLSRHPNHTGSISQTDEAVTINDPVP